MRLAENESRRVGMKFEALVELSSEAEDNATSRDWSRGISSRGIEELMKLKYYKRSAVIFVSCNESQVLEA